MPAGPRETTMHSLDTPEARMTLKHALATAAFTLVAGTATASTVNFYTDLSPEAAGATGSGQAWVVYDTIEHTLNFIVDWTGLSGITTVAHIHCCTALAGAGTVGVAVTPGTLPGFPSGLSSGHYESVVDLDLPSSFTAGFVNNFAGGNPANAIAAFLAGIDDGKAYLNVHSSTFPAGEIRGFLAQVPEPPSLALTGLAALGMAGLAGLRRRRH